MATRRWRELSGGCTNLFSSWSRSPAGGVNRTRARAEISPTRLGHFDDPILSRRATLSLLTVARVRVGLLLLRVCYLDRYDSPDLEALTLSFTVEQYSDENLPPHQRRQVAQRFMTENA